MSLRHAGVIQRLRAVSVDSSFALEVFICMHRGYSYTHLEPMEVIEAHYSMLGVAVSLDDCLCLTLRLVCNFTQSSKVQGIICREGIGLEIELQVLVHLRVRRHKKRRATNSEVVSFISSMYCTEHPRPEVTGARRAQCCSGLLLMNNISSYYRGSKHDSKKDWRI